MILALATLLAAPQAQTPQTLDDYLKAADREIRPSVMKMIDTHVNLIRRFKNPELDVVKAGGSLHSAARTLRWESSFPVLISGLRGRQGHEAAVLLHALTLDAPVETLAYEVEKTDHRALIRLAVDAASPFHKDKEASARRAAVGFLHSVAGMVEPDAAGKKRSFHGPETFALLRKTFTAVLKDADEQVRQSAKEGLDALEKVGK